MDEAERQEAIPKIDGNQLKLGDYIRRLTGERDQNQKEEEEGRKTFHTSTQKEQGLGKTSTEIRKRREKGIEYSQKRRTARSRPGALD